ncbi:hypothetical protein GCM10027046_30160 [Uliginosibacterium flavum]|uniref:Tetratricopeptide repeat protein n=1 Tax=Uliginosibacterium flavum TaxID=1396831 RepID=A0ABV2TIV2_9RHOO
MDALELLEAHRYEEAINAYRINLQETPDDWASFAGLARVLQASGDYEAALPLFERVDEYERQRTPGSAGRKADMACVQWCLGRREEAKQLMRGLVDGILDRTIQFADLAGGVQQGALLYFMGITTHDSEAADYALAYLRRLSKKSRIKHWPGPVALHLLGQLDAGTLLNEACGHSHIAAASQAVADSILSRRQLCVALFHVGSALRAQGLETECAEWMRACVALKNPLVEPEWFLAKHEFQHHP